MAKDSKTKNVSQIDTAANEDADIIVLDEKGSKKKKKGGVLGLLFGMFFVIIITSLSAAIGFDLFGTRSKVVIPLLQKVPIVKNYFPENSEEEEKIDQKELQERVRELEAEVEKYKTEIERFESLRRIDTDTISNLEPYKEEQEKYKEERGIFEKQVALNDPNAYVNYYKSILPENQEAFYEEASDIVEKQKEVSKYVSMISSMDESSAAKILEELVNTDLDFVVMIIKNLGSDTSGTILSSMDHKKAANILKRMAPVQ